MPAVLARVAVWLFSASESTSHDGLLGRIAWMIREQPVPAGIVFFMVIEMLVYRWRHSLPGAERLGVGGRVDVPREIRARFEGAEALLEEAERLQRKRARALETALTEGQREHLRESLAALGSEMNHEPFNQVEFDAAYTRANDAVAEHLDRWRKGSVREYGEAILIAFAIAAALRIFVFEPFRIPTGSMLPTLKLQDHIFVNKLAYGLQIPWSGERVFAALPPDRGDVIVFRYPMNREQDFVKRAVGQPGDVITVESGHPVINGWPVPSCEVGTLEYNSGEQAAARGQLFVEFLGDTAYFTLYREGHRGVRSRRWPATGNPGFRVEEGEAFVLGDNRLNSMDSREWFGGRGGGVPFNDIKGKALFVWLRFDASGDMIFGDMFTSVNGDPELPETAPVELRARLAYCLGEGRPTETWPPSPER